MKTFWKRIVSVLTCLALAAAPILMTACSPKQSGGEEEKSEYTVVYDLNYEGSTNRTVTVSAGTRATNWKPSRADYDFIAWYTEPECTTKFDFSQYINADTHIYAKWEKQAAQYTVTFDFNYSGKGEPAVVKVTENEKIAEQYLPKSPRLGMEISGWFEDADCTLAWNMDRDVVTEDVTLYAAYETDASIPRNPDGSIKYENVVVNFWVGSNFGYDAYLKSLVNRFNSENTGKIRIDMTFGGNLVQSTTALRMQQMPGMNAGYTGYYSVEEVYDFAGIEYSRSDYFEQASRDSYVGGKMYSVPVIMGAPFFVYNKTLMQKYAENGALPTNYSKLSALLTRAYNGEIGSNASFKTVLTNRSWTFKEAPSYVAFLQNSADYYVYENGSYVNKWSDSAVYANAVKAMQNTYDLFGEGGALHGSSNGFDSEYTDDNAINQVKNGNALLGLVNIAATIAPRAADISSLGILPLSGLFTDNTDAQSQQVPVHTVGLQFYKAKDVSLVELAAAAEFADFVSRNSAGFGESGWYPMRKSAAENTSFTKSSNAVAKIVLQTGDPENFRSLDGFVNGKSIFNVTAAESYIVPVLEGSAEVEKAVEDLMAAINGQLL